MTTNIEFSRNNDGSIDVKFAIRGNNIELLLDIIIDQDYKMHHATQFTDENGDHIITIPESETGLMSSVDGVEIEARISTLDASDEPEIHDQKTQLFESMI